VLLAAALALIVWQQRVTQAALGQGQFFLSNYGLTFYATYLDPARASGTVAWKYASCNVPSSDPNLAAWRSVFTAASAGTSNVEDVGGMFGVSWNASGVCTYASFANAY
jgi:hypothetical protein